MSLIIENEQETYLNPKNLTETDKDLSSFVLNRNHILNTFRSTTKWPLYNLYVKYIKYLNGENNSFDNMTNQELKNLFKSKNTIVFRNNITRKRRNFLKGKANIFYNYVISDDSLFNFTALQIFTKNTKYFDIPEYIIEGTLSNLTTKDIAGIKEYIEIMGYDPDVNRSDL